MLGGKAADAISKAVSLKENNDVGNESKIGVKKEGGSMFKRDEVPLSPLSNLYPYQTAVLLSTRIFFLVSPSLGDLVVIITIVLSNL